jgi:hypothetical protein
VIQKGRIIAIPITIEGNEMMVVNVYANCKKEKKMEALEKTKEGLQRTRRPTIAGGDFQLDPEEDEKEWEKWEDFFAERGAKRVKTEAPTKGNRTIDHIFLPETVVNARLPRHATMVNDNQDHNTISVTTQSRRFFQQPLPFPSINKDVARSKIFHQEIQERMKTSNKRGLEKLMEYGRTAHQVAAKWRKGEGKAIKESY